MKIMQITVLISCLFTLSAIAGKQEPYIPSNQDPTKAMKYYQSSQFDKALDLYRKLAKSGDKHAQYMLSIMHFNGYGTDKNVIESYAWAKLSTETQIKDFEKNYAFVNQNLPDNAKAAAKERYNELFENFNDLAVARRYRVIFNKELPMCTGSRIRGNCGNIRASCNGVNVPLTPNHEEKCKEYAKKLDPFYISRIKESSEQVREYILEQSNPSVTVSETQEKEESNP